VRNEEILIGIGGDMFGFEREWREVEEHMKKRGEICLICDQAANR